jgi:23S rRNA (cytosine1962-C5)-methyltransferase
MQEPLDRATGYTLLDAGDERRLERFGAVVVDRPAPSAPWPIRAPADAWRSADLRFDREDGWSGRPPDAWLVALADITLELRATGAGQVGAFPEQSLHWSWLGEQLVGRLEPAVLHLFAHTGATTLALARLGARVTHVDGSRPAISWARRNAEHSGLADAAIRWIVDDALAFTEREARRGRRYDGFVLDPPSYGHGPKGTRWELGDMLPQLLDACAAVSTDDAFALLTTHTTGVESADLGDALVEAFGRGPGSSVESEPIEIVAESGAVLPLGAVARLVRA